MPRARSPAPTTVPSARSATPIGRSTEPSGPLRVTHVADRWRRGRPGGGADQHDRLASGRPHGLVAVLHPAVVDQLLPGGEDELAGPRWFETVAALDSSTTRGRTHRGALAVPRADLDHLVPDLLGGPPAQGGAELLGDAGEDPQVGQRAGVVQHLAELTDPALPVHERAGLVGRPAPPGTRRRRRGSPRRRAPRGDTTKPAASTALRARRRVVQVGGVHATDDQAAELAGGGRGDDGVAVPAGGLGQVLDAPCGGQVDPRGGVGDRTATGQQGRQRAGLDGAPVTRAARDPRDAGTGDRRPAWPRRRARRARRPVRSPTSISAPLSSATSPSCARASIAAARRRDGSGSACRTSCAGPREVNGAIE